MKEPYCTAPKDVYELACRNVVLRAEVGSTVYGTGLPGAEDHDEIAVYVMPPEHVLGVKPCDSIVWRTAGASARSTPQDTDLAMYSLKKYIGLAAAGNPSILVPLFTPDDKVFQATVVGKRLRAIRAVFVSKGAGLRFKGYMEGQRRRMVDSRAGLRAPRVNRPELIEQFGYDTKYAMHMLRLGFHGIELMSTGQIELPIPGSTGDLLRSVRHGEVAYEQVLAMSEDLDRDLAAAIAESSWPNEVESYLRDRLIQQLTFLHWGVADTRRG